MKRAILLLTLTLLGCPPSSEATQIAALEKRLAILEEGARGAAADQIIGSQTGKGKLGASISALPVGTVIGMVPNATYPTFLKSPATNWTYGVPLQFSASEGSFPNSIVDPVYYEGWNLDTHGSPVVAGKEGVGTGYEGAAPRNADPTQRETEWHAVAVDTAGTTHRFITSYMYDDGSRIETDFIASEYFFEDLDGTTVSAKLDKTNGFRLFKPNIGFQAMDNLSANRNIAVFNAGSTNELDFADGSTRAVFSGTWELYGMFDYRGTQFILGRFTAPSAGGAAGDHIQEGSTANFGDYWGTGAPTVTGAIGSVYKNSTTAAGTPWHNVDGSTTWAKLQSTYTVGSITAATTHTQTAATALTGAINDVTVCANANDAVKLPTIAGAPGASEVICNDGAQVLAVWPASGQACGAAATDAVCAATIAAAACQRYTAITATKWAVGI